MRLPDPHELRARLSPFRARSPACSVARIAGLLLILVGVLSGCAGGGPRVESASDPRTTGPASLQHPQPFLHTERPVAQIHATEFDAEAKRLFLAGEDKTVWVLRAPHWEPVTRFHLPTWLGSDGEIYDLAMSPDDRFLAVAGCFGCSGRYSAEDTYLVYVLDAATGEVVGTGDQYGSSVDLEFSPDGRWLAGADLGRQVLLWRVASNGEIHLNSELPGHAGTISDLRWSPDSASLYTVGGDGLLIKWSEHDISGWYPEWHKSYPSRLYALEISSSGEELYLALRDRRIELADASTGEIVENLLTLKSARIFTLRRSADGKRLVYGSGAGEWGETGIGSLSLGDHNGNRFERSKDTVFSLSWTGRDTDPIAIVPGRGHLHLHEGDTHRFIAEKKGIGADTGWLRSDGERIAYKVEDEDESATIFDLARLERTTTEDTEAFTGGQAGLYAEVTYNKPVDGQFVVREINSTRRKAFTVDDARVHAWAVFRRNLFAIASGYRLAMVDLGKRSVLECHGHRGRPKLVSWMRGGRLLLSAGDDRTIRVWRAETCELLLSIFDDRVGEWVAWTPEGLYAHSPGGRALLGFRVNRSPRELPLVKSADDYPELHQPERILEILKRGTATPPAP